MLAAAALYTLIGVGDFNIVTLFQETPLIFRHSCCSFLSSRLISPHMFAPSLLLLLNLCFHFRVLLVAFLHFFSSPKFSVLFLSVYIYISHLSRLLIN